MMGKPMNHYSGDCDCYFCTDFDRNLSLYEEEAGEVKKPHPLPCSCESCAHIEELFINYQKSMFRKTIYAELEALSSVFDLDLGKYENFLKKENNYSVLSALYSEDSLEDIMTAMS